MVWISKLFHQLIILVKRVSEGKFNSETYFTFQLSGIICLKMRTAGSFNTLSVEILWKREIPN